MASIGLSAYGIPIAELVELAKCADELGFDALWLGEHLLRPAAYGSEHPASGTQHHTGPIIDKDTELVDPWVTHAAIAAVTSRIKLGTAVYVTSLRHPLQTARITIGVQELSGGRVLFGIGAGWLEEEFAAFEVPFTTRYSRTEECIEIMRKAWSGVEFSHAGKHFEFGTVQVHPRRMHVPIVLGGNTPNALARAARLGDTWFSSGTPSLAAALKAPRITDAAVRLADQARDAGWSFEDYLAAVLEREVSARNASGAESRIKSAGFPARKTLDDFDWDAQPTQRQTVAALASGRFLTEARNIVLLGPPGTGKTHLAIRLGIVAARHGVRVLFATATDWVTRLTEAHRQGRLPKDLTRLRRYGLIVVDEVGYLPFEQDAANLGVPPCTKCLGESSRSSPPATSMPR